MNRPEKMNGLYKAGFVLMLVCLALFITAIVFMLIIENIRAGVIIAVAGVFLCLVAIILTMFSKPKSQKAKQKGLLRELLEDDEEDYDVESDEEYEEEYEEEENSVLTEDETDDIIDLDKGE